MDEVVRSSIEETLYDLLEAKRTKFAEHSVTRDRRNGEPAWRLLKNGATSSAAWVSVPHWQLCWNCSDASANTDLSRFRMIAALDVYGPITDNGGMAEMADLRPKVRKSPQRVCGISYRPSGESGVIS